MNLKKNSEFFSQTVKEETTTTKKRKEIEAWNQNGQNPPSLAIEKDLK